MTMTDVSRAAAIDAPLLQTELPGPIAASIIARDERVTSPSLTRLYPLVVRRGRGCLRRERATHFAVFNEAAATG